MDQEVTPEDEYWHSPDPDDARWRESYYFDFYDPGSDFGWFGTIGRRPHKEYVGSAFGVIWEGDAYFKLDYGYTNTDEAVRVGGLEFTPAVPHARWHIRQMTELHQFEPGDEAMHQDPDDFPLADTPLYGLDVDVTFDAIHDPEYFFTDGETNVFSPIYTGHAEQAGRVTGEVRLGGKTITVDGFGGRDHSWGPRDWFSPDAWRWLSGSYDDATAIHIYRLRNDLGEATKGYLLLNDETHPLTEVSLDTTFYDDGTSQREVTFEIVDAADRHFQGRGEVATKPLVMGFDQEDERVSIRRAPATFYSDGGDAEGYGWTEFGRKYVE